MTIIINDKTISFSVAIYNAPLSFITARVARASCSMSSSIIKIGHSSNTIFENIDEIPCIPPNCVIPCNFHIQFLFSLVPHKVRGDVTLVELHSLYNIEIVLNTLSFFKCHHNFPSHLTHGFKLNEISTSCYHLEETPPIYWLHLQQLDLEQEQQMSLFHLKPGHLSSQQLASPTWHQCSQQGPPTQPVDRSKWVKELIKRQTNPPQPISYEGCLVTYVQTWVRPWNMTIYGFYLLKHDEITPHETLNHSFSKLSTTKANKTYQVPKIFKTT